MLVGITGLQLSCIANVHAEQWLFAPAVRVFSEYDDNPELAISNPKSNSALLVSPRVRAAQYTETTKLDIGAELGFARNNSEAIDDEYNQRIAFRVHQRTSQLNALTLDGDFQRDSLRRDVTGGGDVIADRLPDIDSGLVVKDVDRHRIHLTPGWRRQLTQRVSASAAYDLTDVSYSNQAGTGLVEYAQHSIRGGLGYQVTEKASVGGSVGYSAYRPDNDEETDNVTVGAGLNYVFSERAQGNLHVGGRNTTFTLGSVDSSSAGFVLDAGYSMRTETGNVRAGAEHSALPSGVGRLLEANRLDLEWNQGLAERIGAFSRISAYRTREIDDRRPESVSRYASFEIGASWALTRQLSLDSLYRLRWQDSDNAISSVNSNAVFVGINYGSVENERFSGSLRY